MTHVSRRKLSLTTEKVLQEFVRSSFSKLSSREVFSILNTVLSKTEIAMIKKRTGIVLLLESGYHTNEISEIIKTTRQTVERFRLQIKQVPQKDISLLVRKLKTTFAKELVKDFIKNLDISKRSLLKKITPF